MTRTSVRYEYTARFGAIGAALMGRMLDKQFTSGFTGFLDDLHAAACSQATG